MDAWRFACAVPISPDACGISSSAARGTRAAPGCGPGMAPGWPRGGGAILLYREEMKWYCWGGFPLICDKP